MGASLSRPQGRPYSVQVPVYAASNVSGSYPGAYIVNPGQIINKGTPVGAQGVYLAPGGYGYPSHGVPPPIYPAYQPSQAYPPQHAIPFPQPIIQPPGPPVTMPPTYSAIPDTTRRGSAFSTPFPAPIVEPQPQITRPSNPLQQQQQSQTTSNIYGPSNDSYGQANVAPQPRRPVDNPLPPPPRDVLNLTPYRDVLDLPKTAALLRASYGTTMPASQPKDDSSVGRRKSFKGLFPSLSTKRKRREEPSVVYVPTYLPQPQPTASSSSALAAAPPPPPVPPPLVPPVRFNHEGPFSDFMNHSPHRIMYQNKLYPTAVHLYEALKFIGRRPDLAEQLRSCPHAHEVYPLSASYQEFQRNDWGEVFLKSMEEVLYLKFKQHPDIRHLLMGTGVAPLIYAETDDAHWGDGPQGQGSNELGKALVRVRDRLRAEGYGLP